MERASSSSDGRESVLILHLLDGEPQGPRVLEITHTNTKAIAVPRTTYERVSRSLPEFKLAGCYILVYDPVATGPFTEKIYVGQADVAQIRLDQHARDAEKDWTWLVLFTSRDGRMNNVHAQYLEARLVSIARQIGRAELTNGNSPQEPNLNPADKAMARRFLEDILVYCPILGLTGFSTPRGPVQPLREHEEAAEEFEGGTQRTGGSTVPSAPIYHLESMPDAHGYNTEEGFVVLKGSPIRPHVSDSADQRYSVNRTRTQLTERGVIQGVEGTIRFARDHLFNSPSHAAVIILGYPVSGRTTWITAGGQTLNEVEAGTIPRLDSRWEVHDREPGGT